MNIKVLRMVIFCKLLQLLFHLIPKNAEKTLKWVEEMPFDDLTE